MKINFPAGLILGAFALILTGCSTAHLEPGAAVSPAAVTAAAATAPTASVAGAGRPAKSFSCQDFSIASITTALAPIVPKSEAKLDDGPLDTAGVEPGGFECMWDVWTPGTDTASADRGLAQLSLTVNDDWGTPLEGDGNDDERQVAAFRDQRSPETAVTENGATITDHDVTGVGGAAYWEDTVFADDGEPASQFGSRLSILHDPRPYGVQVNIDYVAPQPDQALPDRSLDKAMQSESSRHDVVLALARPMLGTLTAP